MTRIHVLAGGPDAEHDVSVASAEAIAEALRASAEFEVTLKVFRSPDELSFDDAEVVFPALHGPWGEGGPAQSLLESTGIPFVGSGSNAAAIGMDKIKTKAIASALSIQTPVAEKIEPENTEAPLDYPFIVKPVAEGSSVGLYVVRDEASWSETRAAICDDPAQNREWMAEAFVGLTAGRELTVPLLDQGSGLAALSVIEIVSATGVYDFEAKYERADTGYVVGPDLPEQTVAQVQSEAVALVREIGVRHLARVDFRLDEQGSPWLLEVNTLPGFTAASLLPKAAALEGLDMPALCRTLVERATADHSAIARSLAGDQHS